MVYKKYYIKDNKLNLVSKVLFIIIVTALLGEIKITVFDSSFRFGIGSAAFLFFLLYYKNIPYFIVGISAGTFITLFRMLIDYFSIENFDFFSSLLMHSPIIGYYSIFSISISLFLKLKYKSSSLYLWIAGSLSDVIANSIELFVRTVLFDELLLTSTNIMYVVIVGFLRSFFVIGLINMVEEQQRKFEQIQMINSTLYVEGFYLRKVMKEIEELTGKSYNLYSNLKDNNNVSNKTSILALTVAQEIHEVKKDTYRILTGLEKTINKDSKVENISIQDLNRLIKNSNQKYAKHLKKEIEFDCSIKTDRIITKVYPLLVIFDNLITNSVEAISEKGYIKIIIEEKENNIEFYIIDNGVGISENDKKIIFEPGFTTKFDDLGKSNTGIGLSHVKSLVVSLKGSIDIINEENETIFKVVLPLESLCTEEKI